jgi:hypothetical protein
MNITKKLSPLSVLILTAMHGTAATAASEDLEARIVELENKLGAMETKTVTAGEKGGFVIGDTTVTLGGYVKADMVYTNNGVNGTNGLIFARQHVTTADEEGDNHLDLTARESRIFLKTSSIQGGMPFTTYIEMDFYGSDGNEVVSNSYSPRLRQAFGSWGNWLIGQSWSTFVDPAHFGELNAFGQHASTIFIRQTQIRYTQPLGFGSLMLALENPEDGDDDAETPDVIARLNYDADWGHASVGVLSRELANNGDRTRGTAYSVTGKVKLPTGGDIRAQYNSGALGRYMGVAAYEDLDLASGDVDSFDSSGYSIALRHPWSQKLASNIMYSATQADSDASIGRLETSESLHINLMYYATPKISYGAEYAQWDTETFTAGGTEDQSLDVIQLSARYKF